MSNRFAPNVTEDESTNAGEGVPAYNDDDIAAARRDFPDDDGNEPDPDADDNVVAVVWACFREGCLNGPSGYVNGQPLPWCSEHAGDAGSDVAPTDHPQDYGSATSDPDAMSDAEAARRFRELGVRPGE